MIDKHTGLEITVSECEYCRGPLWSSIAVPVRRYHAGHCEEMGKLGHAKLSVALSDTLESYRRNTIANKAEQTDLNL